MFTLPVDRSPAAPPHQTATVDRSHLADLTNIEAGIAAAIATAVRAARTRGQSLADLQADVLTDHNLLDAATRRRLSEILSEAWERV